METFTVSDVRQRTDELIRGAEQGQLAVVTKHGHPVFVAVPFDDALLDEGVGISLALNLFGDGKLSLDEAAKFAGLSAEAFVGRTQQA